MPELAEAKLGQPMRARYEVRPAADGGWMMNDLQLDQQVWFPSKGMAMVDARRAANANRPSVVTVRREDDSIEEERAYED